MVTHTRWGSIALVLVLVAGACSDDDTAQTEASTGEAITTTPADDRAPEFVEGSCPPPIPNAEGFRCGTVAVPVQRGDDSSGTIDLAVAVLPASQAGAPADPAVVIDVPEPTLAGYEGHAALPERVGRDVVMFDMRGMGGSTPSLECTEIDYLVRHQDTVPEVRERYLEGLDACRERLEEEGVDLTAYTVAAVADDIIDIRRALGYETWNLIGYGQATPEPGLSSAEVVYELMRRDGDAIRSVTMEAPTPPQQDPWSVQIENLARVIDSMLTACLEQVACAEANPDLREQMAAGFRQPRTEYPVTSGAGDPMTVVFDPAWAGVYTSAGMTVDFLPSFPALRNLPREELAQVIGATTTRSSPDNLAVHGFLLSVLCPQTGADTTPADRTTPTDIGAVSWGVYAERDSCDRWTFAEPDASLDAPVSSDIPTLLLVGQFDPFNTAAGARLLASTLTNSYVYEVPAATANPLGHSECARDIRNAFVRDPSSEPDSSCIASVPPVQFSVPAP